MRSNAELLKLDLKNDWLVHSILPRGGTIMIAGQPKVGKSLLSLGLVHAIVNPKVDFWHGFKIVKHGSVLYCQFDMPVGSHMRRIAKLQEAKFNFNGTYHVTMDEVPPGFNLLKDASMHWLQAQVEDLKPEVIVFDVIRRFYAGDENSSDVAGAFIAAVNDVLKAGDSTGVLIHHTNKTSEISKNMGIEKDPVNAVRGSSAISGSVDTIAAFNDSGSQIAYQGRDISLRYNLRRDKHGLHNRWIKTNAQQRESAVEHLIARYMVQDPHLGKNDIFNLAQSHVEALEYEEFCTRHSLVAGKVASYEWS